MSESNREENESLDQQPRNIASGAVLFEASLGVAAVLVGRLLGYDPLQHLKLDAGLLREILMGLLATVPLVVALLGVRRLRLRPLERLWNLVERRVVPLFQDSSAVELLVVALAAGIGEELLFRGLLQQGLAHWWGAPLGPWLALVLASLLFGLAHWLSTTYLVLATLLGFYLGGLVLVTGSLVPPIVVHTVYDLFALWYLRRM